jgi:hypothetical protein
MHRCDKRKSLHSTRLKIMSFCFSRLTHIQFLLFSTVFPSPPCLHGFFSYTLIPLIFLSSCWSFHPAHLTHKQCYVLFLLVLISPSPSLRSSTFFLSHSSSCGLCPASLPVLKLWPLPASLPFLKLWSHPASLPFLKLRPLPASPSFPKLWPLPSFSPNPQAVTSS